MHKIWYAKTSPVDGRTRTFLFELQIDKQWPMLMDAVKAFCGVRCFPFNKFQATNNPNKAQTCLRLTQTDIERYESLFGDALVFGDSKFHTH